jgi:hypothetical protein
MHPFDHRILVPGAIAGTLLLLLVRAGAAAQEINVAQVIADFGFPADATERIRRGEVLESDPSESSDRELAVGNTSQAIAGLIPVPEGTVVFYRSRVSTDRVAGFGSSVKKGVGRGVMAKQLMEIFKRSRAASQTN